MFRSVLLLLTALAVVLAGASPASARAPRSGPCLPDGTGPTCHFWYGKVVGVDDGDTIDVDIAGDGTRRPSRVRFNGIQAMEQSVYSPRHPSRRRGECNALEATARLEQLIRASRGHVRLSAQYAASRQDVHGHARLRRVVAVRSGGAWQDTGLTVLREGHALWLAATEEDAWNERYARAEQEARTSRRFLWDPAHCGTGPDQDVPLRVWAMWDPLGNDAANLAGEWLKVRNVGTRAVALSNWWVRDAMLRRFTFRAGTVLGAGETLTVYTAPGQDTADALHWGLSRPVFQNPETADHHLGDGVYLFDPQGDLRSATVYPCLVDCSDPLAGALSVSAQPRRPESVRIRNGSGATVDLYGYALALPGSMYAFPPGSVVPPGQTLQVDIGGDPRDDAPLHLHWGVDRYLLPDSGGSVAVTSFSDVTLACAAWGSGRC